MKSILAAFLLLLSVLHLSAQTSAGIDILHYRFQLELSDATDSIMAQAGINIRLTSPGSQLVLDLASLEKDKGMTVMAVSSNSQDLPFVHRNDQLTVTFREKKMAGDTVLLNIRYTGIPSDGLIISKNKFGHRTFFADNWPNRGHNWIPCHDDPVDKATVEFIVTAPEHYQVIANGVQVEETNLGGRKKITHWKEDVPIATKVMVIGAADFAVNLSGVVDCIPVYSWVYPEERENGFYDYAQAKDILPFFITNVGPYGYKKLANVESKTKFGGLENANTIFYSEKSITGDRSDEDLLTHEIAHQWFGNMATEKSFAHLWLSEGFATYFTTLYFEKKYGWDTARQMLQNDRQETIAYSHLSDHPVVDTAIHDYMLLLNANSYQKGGWILHMLRRKLGDSIFWKSIRQYYATYAGINADTDDLRRIFENVSGKDLKSFFTQWLFTAGQPQISLSWKMKGKKLRITVSQSQTSIFNFPLDIEIQTAGGKKIQQTFEITRKEESFDLAIPEKVIKLIPDPNTNLLFELKP